MIKTNVFKRIVIKTAVKTNLKMDQNKEKSPPELSD